MPFSIRALDLTRWADQLSARSTLPQLIRRLALATANDIRQCNFPSHESVQRSGNDGVLESDAGNTWIPAGKSLWELSTNKSVKTKADGDFDTRTDNASDDAVKSHTYVAVTLRHWEHKQDWRTNQLAKQKWKDVCAYDADDIEQWLETAPAVSIWLSRQLGLHPENTDDVTTRWDAVSNSTTKPLTPSVFLVSRSAVIADMEAWLNGEPNQLQINFRSPNEIVDFYCAYVTSLKDDDREKWLARSAIVGSQDAWRQLRDSTTPMIIIVDPTIELTSEEVARAVRNGHHVLVGSEQSPDLRDSIELPLAAQFEMVNALEGCGYTTVQAEQAARSAAGSVAILKRTLAMYPQRHHVLSNIDAIQSQAIPACLLLGGWDERFDADRAALERLSETTYSTLEAGFQSLATCRDPILLHADRRWRIISKDEAWAALDDRITPSVLKEFEKLAVEILTDDDPRFELPEAERMFANLRGHIPQYSPTLKKHVAETIALLGTIGDSLHASGSCRIDLTLDRIVSAILTPVATWRRWASLGSNLTMLAEASPDVFLAAIRNELAKDKSELVQILVDEETPLFARCNHAGLLWALEGLAYSPHYVGAACSCLLGLTARDPGGKWTNRPKNSLMQILSYWMPHTTVSLADRIKVLDLLIRKDGDTAWAILLSLLPGPFDNRIIPTHRPYWRNWANDWLPGATESDAESLTFAVAERLISGSGTNSRRWQKLLDHIAYLPAAFHDEFVSGIESLQSADLPDTDRRILTDAMKVQIHRHRQNQHKEWTLSTDLLDRLDAAHSQLQPRSSIVRHAWLFMRNPDRHFSYSGDLEKNREAIEDARQAALKEILADHGFEGIEVLIDQVESPLQVGRCLAIASQDDFISRVIPGFLNENDRHRDFAHGFVWFRFYPDNWPWIESLLGLCVTPSAQAWLICSLPFERRAWNLAESMGDECNALYWDRSRAFNPELNETDVAFATEKLVLHRKPGHAIDLVAMALHGKKPLSQETLFLALEGFAAIPNEDKQDYSKDLVHDGIQEIIEALQEMPNVAVDRLLSIEWNYLPLLDSHFGHSPKALYRQLASSPQWFVDALSLIYNPNPPLENDSLAHNPNRRVLSERAFKLLSNWSTLPGINDNQEIDFNILRSWCLEARSLAAQVNRLDACDGTIGEMLAHSPADADGTWPCLATRTLIEEICSERLNSGVARGIANSRGAVFRGRGGAQERDLAKKYRANAEALRLEFPVTASILDLLTRMYAGEARGWDETDKWESP